MAHFYALFDGIKKKMFSKLESFLGKYSLYIKKKKLINNNMLIIDNNDVFFFPITYVNTYL